MKHDAQLDERDSDSFWRRLIAVRPQERAQVALAVLAFFCVLAAISLLRPVRDEMGLRGGVRNLKYLWSVTLAGTLLSSFAFAALSSRRPRRAFMNASYRTVALVWLAFLPAVLLVEGAATIWIARTFYVVHAVTNVLLVSLFWAALADMLDSRQARRLFGLIAVGGTLGVLFGTYVTGKVAPLGIAAWMILPAALFLEASIWVSAALARRVASGSPAHAATGASAAAAALPLGGDAWDGFKLVLRSPYLSGIAVFTFVFGVVQTFFTFQQNRIVDVAIATAEQRQVYFARTENAAQWLTLLTQLFVTGALMRRLGVGGGLLVLPVVGVIGLVVLGTSAELAPTSLLAIVTVCLVAWRGFSHATLRPAREALYVPTTRDEKFKAKSFTDTFAFRGGDLAAVWSFDALSLAAAAFVAAPLALAWGALGFWLARRQLTLASGAASTGARAATKPTIS